MTTGWPSRQSYRIFNEIAYGNISEVHEPSSVAPFSYDNEIFITKNW